MRSTTPSTLADAIERAAEGDATVGFRFVSNEGVPGFGSAAATEAFFSYAEIEEASARFGGALQALGLRKGDRVALICPTNEDFVLCFFGAMRAGVIAVPIYPPLGIGRLHGYLDNTRHIVGTCGARVLVTSAAIKRLLGTVQAAAPELERVVTIEELRSAHERLRPPALGPSDVAFLQYTSGSTSRPKGVTLTHANLLANVNGFMRDGLRVTAEDRGVSWLPLYHDMGLIGFVLAPIVFRIPVVFLPPLLFVKRPVTWLQALTRHKGTIAFGPNFAFALCVKRIRDRELANLDLSTWRVAGCGAEPIRPETLEAFAERFANVGFRPNALVPSYGMAESSLAISFGELGEGMKTVTVEAEALWSTQTAKVTAGPADGAVRLVSCGKPFPGHSLRAFPPEDTTTETPLPERRVGELRVRGPSVMDRYWDDPERTVEAFAGSTGSTWLRTGDLGFLHEGDVYLCGRSKDVIIVHGRNYYPQDIEWEVSRAEGVRKGNVVAFGAAGFGSTDHERVVVAFECGATPVERDNRALSSEHQAIVQAVRALVQENLGLTLDDVVPLPPSTLPKTSSGKLQRALTRHLYEQGLLTGPVEAPKLSALKEAAKSQLAYFGLAVLGRRGPR